ncbi:hypothetical protein EPN18_04560 [bacterium]|nr:MAG: hypothetical protein EPN18_04560 [bacterium]
MTVITKDGRKFTLPVDSGEIKRIEYADGQSQTRGNEVAGTWNWVAGQTLVARENGSLDVFDASGNKINDGRWELLDAVARRYRFTHRVGGWVDTVVLSSDGRSLDGTNNHGHGIHGSKR